TTQVGARPKVASLRSSSQPRLPRPHSPLPASPQQGSLVSPWPSQLSSKPSQNSWPKGWTALPVVSRSRQSTSAGVLAPQMPPGGGGGRPASVPQVVKPSPSRSTPPSSQMPLQSLSLPSQISGAPG